MLARHFCFELLSQSRRETAFLVRRRGPVELRRCLTYVRTTYVLRTACHQQLISTTQGPAVRVTPYLYVTYGSTCQYVTRTYSTYVHTYIRTVRIVRKTGKLSFLSRKRSFGQILCRGVVQVLRVRTFLRERAARSRDYCLVRGGVEYESSSQSRGTCQTGRGKPLPVRYVPGTYVLP